MVPNALIEERRVSMGRATKLWEEMILPTMVEKGDTETFRQYYEMIDSNKETPPRRCSAPLGSDGEESRRAAAERAATQVTPELLSLSAAQEGCPEAECRKECHRCPREWPR